MEQKVAWFFAPGNKIIFSAFLAFGPPVNGWTTSDDLRDNFLDDPGAPRRGFDLNPPRVALRPRVTGTSAIPPPTISSTSFFTGDFGNTMPGKKAGACSSGAGSKKPGDRSPASHPSPLSGAPGSSHLAGGSPSNTMVSHNTAAVLRDAGLGTVEKYGLRRSTSNSVRQSFRLRISGPLENMGITTVPPPTSPLPPAPAG